MSNPTTSAQQFVDDSTMPRVGHIPAIARMCHRLGLIDRIHNKGTLKLFTEVALRAASVFDLDTTRCSFDTTSVNVWGDYNTSVPEKKPPTSPTDTARTSAPISSNSWSRCFVWKATSPSRGKCKTATPAMRN